MTATASEKHDKGPVSRPKPVTSVREQFIEQSEDWIKRLADELPEEVLRAALTNARMSGEIAEAMKNFGEINQIHEALYLRAMRAIDRIVRIMPNDLLISSLAAPSDFGALVRALSDPRTAGPSREIDPLAGAVGRSIAHRRELAMRAGEMLTSAQVSEFLNISRQAIDKRRHAGRLLAIRQGSDWLYPAFQFGHEDVLEGIRKVIEAHKGADPWVVIDSLLAPDEALGGRSLLEAIRDGDNAAVERHLRQMAGDGFA